MANDNINNEIRSLSDQIKKLAIVIQEIPSTYPDAGFTAYSRGDLVKGGFLNYYNLDNSILAVGATDPNDFDSPVYNRERVYESLQRKSPFLQVINHGTDDLFVIVSHAGTTRFTSETQIRPGETKEYLNVYELRLRSPTVGNPYTVTEYYTEEICCPTSGITPIPVTVVQLLPIEAGVIHNMAILANADFFAPVLTPTTVPCAFKIMVSMSAVGVLNVTIIRGGNTQTIHLNNNVNLVANSVYTFEVLLHNGDTFNLQYTQNATIQVCRIQEMDSVIG